MLGFLDLPFEIRLFVYRHFFGEHETWLFLYVTEHIHRKRFKLEHSASYRLSEVSWHRNILLTCWQCYHEVIDMYRACLTRLVVEFDILQQDQYYKRVGYADEQRHQQYLYGALNGLYHSTHHRALLHNIRHLTIPSIVTPENMMMCIQLTLLPAIEVVEFVASQGQIAEICAINNNLPAQHPAYRHTARYVTQIFDPEQHLRGTNLSWAATSTNFYIASRRPNIRILWTTEVEWTRTCSSFAAEDYPRGWISKYWTSYQRCYAVTFVGSSTQPSATCFDAMLSCMTTDHLLSL